MINQFVLRPFQQQLMFGGFDSLETFEIGLWTDITPPMNYNTTWNQVTEATFEGYTRVPFAPYNGGGFDGKRFKISVGPVSFSASGFVVPETVLGYFVIRNPMTDSWPSVLGLLPKGPFNFATAGDTLTLQFVFSLSNFPPPPP